MQVSHSAPFTQTARAAAVHSEATAGQVTQRLRDRPSRLRRSIDRPGCLKITPTDPHQSSVKPSTHCNSDNDRSAENMAHAHKHFREHLGGWCAPTRTGARSPGCGRSWSCGTRSPGTSTGSRSRTPTGCERPCCAGQRQHSRSARAHGQLLDATAAGGSSERSAARPPQSADSGPLMVGAVRLRHPAGGGETGSRPRRARNFPLLSASDDWRRRSGRSQTLNGGETARRRPFYRLTRHVRIWLAR